MVERRYLRVPTVVRIHTLMLNIKDMLTTHTNSLRTYLCKDMPISQYAYIQVLL